MSGRAKYTYSLPPRICSSWLSSSLTVVICSPFQICLRCSLIMSWARSDSLALMASKSLWCSSSGQLECEEDPYIPTISDVFVTSSRTVLDIIEFPQVSASLTWNSPDNRIKFVRSSFWRADKAGRRVSAPSSQKDRAMHSSWRQINRSKDTGRTKQDSRTSYHSR